MMKWSTSPDIFSILPLLINISEDVDLAYEINHLNNIDQDYLGKLSTTIEMVAEKEKCGMKILETSETWCQY